jgi:iron-sulfur cluster assembly protein
MITITPEAAAQIRKSAEVTNSQDMYLRIAVRRNDDGTFAYGMGFDELGADDAFIESAGIKLCVANAAKDFLMGATLDYGEVNPGEPQFIFINPNDPEHAATADKDKPAPAGG